MEVHAFHLGRRDETLRPKPEQQHRGMRGGATVQQVQVGQRRSDRCAWPMDIAALCLRPREKEVQLVGRQVILHRLSARSRIEGLDPQAIGSLEVVHQAGVQRCHQFLCAAEAPPDQLVTSLAHQCGHLRVARPIIGSLYNTRHQAHLAAGRGTVELMLGGRHSCCVLETVVVAEQADTDLAMIHLGQIDLVDPPVGCGQVLEQEHAKKTPQQGIAFDKRLYSTPLIRELFLHTADEDRHHGDADAFRRRAFTHRFYRAVASAKISRGEPP